MSRTWRTTISWIVMGLLLMLVVGVACGYFLYSLANQAYLDNMMGNLLATLIGVIAGIPVGLGISNWQQKLAQEEELREKTAEEKRRKKRILELISEELSLNHETLKANKTPQGEGMERVVFVDLFKNELWRALSDGGEIEWIEDVNLMGAIAEAYYRIRGLMYFEELYLQNRYFPATHHGTKQDAGQEILNNLFSLDEKATNAIQIALTKIEQAMDKLD